mmetsp:Transcript_47888/g.120552  ORF Transcript_47888/g.120552 Transcript_47888/m.120552 type:complete len:105 (+) Transcript_47888:171-485(+)
MNVILRDADGEKEKNCAIVQFKVKWPSGVDAPKFRGRLVSRDGNPPEEVVRTAWMAHARGVWTTLRDLVHPNAVGSIQSVSFEMLGFGMYMLQAELRRHYELGL